MDQGQPGVDGRGAAQGGGPVEGRRSPAPEDFTGLTERCFRGEPASCSTACPFHLDVRSFLEKASKGKWNSAYKQLRNATVFPVIVAELCEEPCREQCRRTALGDEAIAIRDIEAAVLRNVKEQKPERYVIPPKEQRVAVVGAGWPVWPVRSTWRRSATRSPSSTRSRGGAAACAPTHDSPPSTPRSPGSSPRWRWSSGSARPWRRWTN